MCVFVRQRTAPVISHVVPWCEPEHRMAWSANSMCRALCGCGSFRPIWRLPAGTWPARVSIVVSCAWVDGEVGLGVTAKIVKLQFGDVEVREYHTLAYTDTWAGWDG